MLFNQLLLSFDVLSLCIAMVVGSVGLYEVDLGRFWFSFSFIAKSIKRTLVCLVCGFVWIGEQPE